MKKYLLVLSLIIVCCLLSSCGTNEEKYEKGESSNITNNEDGQKKKESLESVQEQVLYHVPDTCFATVVDNVTASYGLSLNGSKISSDQFYDIIDFCKAHEIEKAWGNFKYSVGTIDFKWSVDGESEFTFKDSDKNKETVSERSALRFLDGHPIYFYSDDLAIFLENTSYSYNLTPDRKKLTVSADGYEWPLSFTWELADKIMKLDPLIDEVDLYLPKKSMNLPFYREGTVSNEPEKTLSKSVETVYYNVVSLKQGNDVEFEDSDLRAIYDNWTSLKNNPIAGQPIDVFGYGDTIEFAYGDGTSLIWKYNEHTITLAQGEPQAPTVTNDLEQKLFDSINYSLSIGLKENADMDQVTLKEIYDQMCDGSFFETTMFSYISEYGDEKHCIDISYDSLWMTVYYDSSTGLYGFEIIDN